MRKPRYILNHVVVFRLERWDEGGQADPSAEETENLLARMQIGLVYSVLGKTGIIYVCLRPSELGGLASTPRARFYSLTGLPYSPIPTWVSLSTTRLHYGMIY